MLSEDDQTETKSPTKSVSGHKAKKVLQKNWLTLGIFTILIIVIGILYVRYQTAQRDLKRLDTTASTKQQVQNLQDKVSKLVDLPQNETPTVATVSDVSKLNDQPFFLHAQNGDQVLIYTSAKRAILYRPTTNKIIEVGPVNIGDVGTTKVN